jgi:hypothetical protein
VSWSSIPPNIWAIIKSHEDGYHAYSALAALGGHPNLDDYTSKPVMPQQAPDMLLVDHGQNLWSHLHRLALGSIFWSNHYYVLLFLASCHPDPDVQEALSTQLTCIMVTGYAICGDFDC